MPLKGGNEMGGGTSLGPSKEDLSHLEKIAKDQLRKTSGEGKRNVFISFAYEDIQNVNLLRGQAINENSNIEFNDWSLKEPFNSARAEYIKQGIRGKIHQSSVTMVYVSDNTSDSNWVNWEIKESIRQGKGVIAVYKGDSPPSKLPDAIIENNVKLVKWTHVGLADAIEDAAQSR